MRPIDADTLKEELFDLKYTREYPSIILTPAGEEIFNSGLEAAIGTVLDAPTIDAVPVVHARWKNVPCQMRSLLFFCSKCGTHSHFKTRYCPDCGAKMDGESGGR